MEDFLANTLKLAKYYKSLGERTFEQLTEVDLFWTYNEASNSIGVIVNHLAGNMLSRWTNFLNEDGEKSWRNRDREFEDVIATKSGLIAKWEEGWDCFLSTLASLTQDDLHRIIYIRNEGHTVADAIQRQMSHYPYHIGQIVFIGKMKAGKQWSSLSIPKGNSGHYNISKFDQEKQIGHFTDHLNSSPIEQKTTNNIRIAVQSDFNELLDFAKSNFIQTYAHNNNPEDFAIYLKKAFDPVFFQQEFDNPESSFYLCKIANELAGYYKINFGEAHTEPSYPNAAEIERLYVKSTYHRKGLGKAMIRHSMALAKSNNLAYLWLSVWEHNPEAIGFYKRLGFEIIDSHIYHIGNDAQTDFIMQLTLN